MIDGCFQGILFTLPPLTTHTSENHINRLVDFAEHRYSLQP